MNALTPEQREEFSWRAPATRQNGKSEFEKCLESIRREKQLAIANTNIESDSQPSNLAQCSGEDSGESQEEKKGDDK